MAKLIMLGVGNGGTLDLYNTCFVIQNETGNFLIDTGGGIEIIKRLNQTNIDYKSLKHIFISHSHTDHILGIFWMFKKISRLAMRSEIKEKINLYCNDEVYEAIKQVSKYILPKKLMDAIYEVVNFIVLQDRDKYNINGINYEFFDIRARGAKQFGFECLINNKRFVFLGDETLNPELYAKIKDAEYVTHEAFCLDSEENIFHAYEKHHSTVKSVSEIMNTLNVKNLILYHTEDSHGKDRKELYLEEGKKYFNGNLIIPDDLDTVEID